MSDYIEKETVFSNLHKHYPRPDDMIASVVTIPAADVAPVRHGRWIDMGDFISCSVCTATRMKEFLSDYGIVERIDARTNYCPDCGAKMDDELEGESDE